MPLPAPPADPADLIEATNRPRDKTALAAIMATAWPNVPSVVFHGGSVPPGRRRDRDVTLVDGRTRCGDLLIGYSPEKL
ncbi:hypothetical protein [Streptosporangium vulgare]|uniref:Uncharacterized protein n=1 Tax=Streptosporangium vulgare TaxID=46190 RepID=A0ABV5THW5_9ACTN